VEEPPVFNRLELTMSYPYLATYSTRSYIRRLRADSDVRHFRLRFVCFGRRRSLFMRSVLRAETLGACPVMPTSRLELAWVTLDRGNPCAAIFPCDDPGFYQQDPAAMVFSRGGFSIFGGLCFC